MMHAQDIKQLIETQLPNSIVTVEGEDGRHFTALVISPEFAGKSRVQKQQLVYGTLGSRIADGTIHALSIKTFTPEEWDQHQPNKES